jgi:hypothetical protein
LRPRIDDISWPSTALAVPFNKMWVRMINFMFLVNTLSNWKLWASLPSHRWFIIRDTEIMVTLVTIVDLFMDMHHDCCVIEYGIVRWILWQSWNPKFHFILAISQCVIIHLTYCACYDSAIGWRLHDVIRCEPWEKSLQKKFKNFVWRWW